ncbi:similar to Saccharomyces cerevisiae YMR129W POM152 Nuclear pore membrane glycoprotein [Maudiozyma saulgeensis]|uniref:Similar to Saccharomyces cerevisiae YMR129W POM152 Nuclear pore membrane glycoprotein n=1 Tax=Maudiozyma saulgeensis TaxID=1789683 RepID=A0A1X7R163_9SACH|nr:similar to Saccharomyces cerevisiae YMR129W POM152 Nuclear pore membrane glycoprotein [Kazachstania saulgeensis]
MTHRFNAFNDTPRGNHWMGASPSRHNINTSSFDRDNILTNDQTRQSHREERNPPSKSTKNKENISGSNTNPLNDKKFNFSDPNVKIYAETLPLLSTEILDVSKQRSLALVTFLIIQIYKIYDLILLKTGLTVSGLTSHNSYFNFLSKYFIIDSLFLYFLPYFKIPRLTFKKYMTYLQIFIMALLTIFLTREQDFFIIVMVLSRWRKLYFQKDLTVTGASINRHQKLIDYSSHFKGALTIKILPENTAMLNPLHESYCLPLDSSFTSLLDSENRGTQINIPVRINSTEEIKLIELEFRDLYTNEIESRNLTTRDFQKILNPSSLLSKDKSLYESDIVNDRDSTVTSGDKKSTMRYINIPLQQIGFYQIKKIIDTKNLNLKIYQSHVIVPHCPTASMIASGNENRCLGDKDEISIELHGVPPLKLSYSKVIDDKVYSFVDTNLEPEFFKSPLKQSNILNSKKTFSTTDLEDLTWARNHKVMISLNSTTVADGHYTYKIDKLTDRLGNVMDFTILSDQLNKKYDLMNEFDVYNAPRASMDESFNSDSPTKRDITINFERLKNWDKDLPLSAKVSYIGSNTGEGINGDVETFDVELNQLSKSFHAEKPGRYILQSISSRYCSGIIIGKSSVTISKPIPPHLNVSSTPIIDQCIGQVGLNFDLAFTGIPPFHYGMKIFKIEGERRKLFETKRLISKGSRNQFTYNPSMEGQYEITFDQISNDLYRDPIILTPSELYTFETSMRVKPSASISLRNYKDSLKLCLNQAAKIPIALRGEPPFSFKYDILETTTNNRMSYSIEDVNSNGYEFNTPEFNLGGDYIVTLVSVKDNTGCAVSLSEPDVRIKVRGDIPSASFNRLNRDGSDNHISIKQNTVVEIPLKLSGEGPFKVKYQHMGSDGHVLGSFENRFETSYKASLKVSKEGLYKLLDVRDSSCRGEIIQGEELFKVSYLKKPTFTIQDKFSKLKKITDSVFTNPPVCQDTGETIDLLLTGSPPFILNYDLITPNGNVMSEKIQVATKYTSLKIPNNEAGEYVVTIKSIYDSNYEELESKSGATINNDPDEKIIKQVVNPLPYIEFASQEKTFRTCSANIDQEALLDPIKIKQYSGRGPFTVAFNVYHESTSRTEELTLENVSPDRFPFQKLYDGLKLGNHVISIVKITDANGCTNDLRNVKNTQLKRYVRDGIENFISEEESAISRNHISISITDVPKIHLLDSQVEYCVGDYVTYQLNGIAPFTIQYTFNDVLLKTQEHSSQFVRLASEPGLITIDSIEDSTSQCLVNFTKPGMEKELKRLSLNVHPIPSVTVSQGNYVVEDIHEGGQAEVLFTFEGTPPFSLTYVRTEDTESDTNGIMMRRPQVVETHKVTDIFTYQYRVVTSLQGTYEAIEISDAFCFAKNDAFFDN